MSHEHVPNIERMPAALVSLNWQRMDPKRLWVDGTQLLVATPVCNHSWNPPDGYYYEFDVVSISCDEDFFAVEHDGESWCWDLDDVDWYVVIRE